MGQEKNAENIPFLRSTQPKSTERVPVVELSGETDVSAGSEFSSWGIAKMKKSRTLSFGYWIMGSTIR